MTRATAALVLLALALGTFSSLQFVWQWIFGAPTILSSWIILVGVIAGAVWPFLILNRRLRSSPIRVGWAAAFLGVAATFGSYWLIQDARVWPLGGWDAWGIWNLHARFLYRGAMGAWRDMFDPALAWTHNDYPLLLPALVSSFWTLVGSETHLVPASVALVYTLLTIAIATCAASACAGHQRGWLAGLLLLASPGFLLSTSGQMADIPLGCYMLMTFACLQTAQVYPEARFPFIVFAGLSAGFAAWTKNEGALFIMVVIAAWCASSAWLRSWRPLRVNALPFAAGLALPLILIVAFKTFLAPPSDLQFTGSTWERLAAPDRYAQIAIAFVMGIARIGGGVSGTVAPAILIGIGLLLFVSPLRKLTVTSLTMLLTVPLMLAGYFMVYVTSPHFLQGHLSSSLDRLLLHLWPSAVFLVATLPAVAPSETVLPSDAPVRAISN